MGTGDGYLDGAVGRMIDESQFPNQDEDFDFGQMMDETSCCLRLFLQFRSVGEMWMIQRYL